MADPASLDTRELERKSQDRVKVLNPTDQDYAVTWDGYQHRVAAKGQAVFPRYIANKYMKEMTDKILITEQDNAVKGENEKRRSQGKEEMEKYQGGDQPVFEDKFRFARGVSNPEARKQVMKTLYGGLVEEYGLDLPTQAVGKVDQSGTDEAILEAIELEGSAAPSPKAPIEELEDKNVFELQKVARDKGVEFSKTDKKDELIAKISQ